MTINPSVQSSVPGQVKENETAARQGLWRRALIRRHYNVTLGQTFILLDRGTDKLVLRAPHLGDRKVVYAPVRKWGGIYSRESALKQEYRKIQAIKSLVRDDSHLALEMTPLAGRDRISNHFTLEVTEARANLEKEICSKEPTFAARLGYCQQFLNGLMNLHRLGMAHGDIKPENCLVYDDGLVKIADFGKTAAVSGRAGKMYKGNLRFCPPEGLLSIKGDIYGSALLMIRVLEETPGILDDQGQLLPVPDKDRESGITGMGRGIEKYVVEHRRFIALDSQTLGGKITRRLPRQMKLAHLSNKRRKEQQELLSHYIDALCEKLVCQIDLPKATADRLALLLKNMAAGDPARRISAAQALDRLTVIKQDVAKHT